MVLGGVMVVSFFSMCAISAGVIAVTSLITYEILRLVWGVMPSLHFPPRLRALLIIVPIFAAHILNIWIYAGVYVLVEYYTSFGTLQGPVSPAALTYHSFIERLYFSATTYTSLGFGDILPTHDLRMLASAEVLNGLVMLGWTVSFTYLSMEKFWSLPHRKGK